MPERAPGGTPDPTPTPAAGAPAGAPAGVPHTYTFVCPPDPTAPHQARRFVTAVLHSHELDELVHDAELCTSELVTNAWVHASHGIVGAVLTLAVDRGPAGMRSGAVRITVHDADRVGRPRLLEGYDAESGRGLWLVDALTRGRWGTTEPDSRPAFGAGGKGVWCELRTGTPG